MRRFVVTAVMALLAAVLLPATALAGQEKVEVCHVEGDGTFHLIEVAEVAYVKAHEVHGDGVPGGDVPGMEGYVFDDTCQPTEVPDTVLAIAYTNLDGIDGYDEAGGDVLIAKLVDSNDDGVPSIGDTVVTHKYPLDFEATQFGTFLVTNHQVTGISNSRPEAVWVLISVPNTRQLSWDSSWQGESYSEHWGGALLIEDDYTDLDSAIQVYCCPPSEPDTAPVSLARPGNFIDDVYIDVDIFM